MNRCAHCGGRFWLVIYRWYGRRFCRAKCREAFLQELDRSRRQLDRWLNFITQPAE